MSTNISWSYSFGTALALWLQEEDKQRLYDLRHVFVCVCVLKFHSVWVEILMTISTSDAKHTLLIEGVVSYFSYQEDSECGCSKKNLNC